jgi:hypothetical protein
MGELCIHSKYVATLGMVRDSYGTPRDVMGLQAFLLAGSVRAASARGGETLPV